jgi:hypothetical protein
MYLLGVWLKAFRHLIQTAFQVLLGLLRLMVMTCRSRSAVEAENLFLRKQLALFQVRKNKARRADGFHPLAHELPEPLVRLAQYFGRGQARDTDPMAPQGVPPVLALEVPGSGKTESAKGHSGVDSPNGARKPELG